MLFPLLALAGIILYGTTQAAKPELPPPPVVEAEPGLTRLPPASGERLTPPEIRRTPVEAPAVQRTPRATVPAADTTMSAPSPMPDM